MNIKLKDRIQIGNYMSYFHKDMATGKSCKKYITEFSVVTGQILNADSIIIIASSEHKTPLDAPSNGVLSILTDTITEQQVCDLVCTALNKRQGIEAKDVTLTCEDTLMLAYDETEASVVLTEYGLIFKRKPQNNSMTSTDYVVCGGTYGSLELIDLNEPPKKFHAQAYRFNYIPNIQEVIGDNPMIRSLMTIPNTYDQIPASMLRDPNNWHVAKLVTFTEVEKIRPYVQKHK